jgi:hypothetical protein
MATTDDRDACASAAERVILERNSSYTVEFAAADGRKFRASTTCGVVCNGGPHGEPLACAYEIDHAGPHSWATLPTFPAAPPDPVLQFTADPELAPILGRMFAAIPAGNFQTATARPPMCRTPRNAGDWITAVGNQLMGLCLNPAVGEVRLLISFDLLTPEERVVMDAEGRKARLWTPQGEV